MPAPLEEKERLRDLPNTERHRNADESVRVTTVVACK